MEESVGRNQRSWAGRHRGTTLGVCGFLGRPQFHPCLGDSLWEQLVPLIGRVNGSSSHDTSTCVSMIRRVVRKPSTLASGPLWRTSPLDDLTRRRLRPGCDASPTRSPRNPYRESRDLSYFARASTPTPWWSPQNPRRPAILGGTGRDWCGLIMGPLLWNCDFGGPMLDWLPTLTPR